MSIFLSVVLGIGIFAGILYACKMLYGKIPSYGYAVGAIVGAIIGFINAMIPKFAPGTPVFWLAPICFGLMGAFYAFLIVWWHRDGSDWKELIPFLVMAVVCYFTTMATAIMTAVLVENIFLVSLFMILPKELVIGTAGFCVANLFWFRHTMRDEGDDGVDIDKIIFIIVTVATVAVMAFLLLALDWGNLFPKQDTVVAETVNEVVDENAEQDAFSGQSQETAELPAETAPIDSSWYMFYHYQLLADNDITDDFNFGPTAWVEGKTAEVAMEEQIARIKLDPSLGAATFASFDVRLGTDFLYPGIHYDQNWSDGYWTGLINQYVQIYMADSAMYAKLVQRFEEFVRKYAKVTLTYQEGITDQMYMVSLTSGSELEVPEVIIAKTDQPNGHVLNYAFLIVKGNQFDVPFRTDCGFQPTNVAEPMKETPKELPKDPQISSGGGGSTPSGGSDPAPRKKKQTERQTEKQTERQTEKQTERQTEKQTERQTERQTNPPETGTPQTGTPETPKQTEKQTDPPQPETPKQTEKQTDPPQSETPKQTEKQTDPPQPETPKDPTKGTKVNVAANDDSGITGDVSTNNGIGATTSTAELPANSNNITQPEIVADVQEKQEINAEQKTGEESSIPSTPALAPEEPAQVVSVNNPGDTGNGGDSINDYTPTTAADIVAGDSESAGTIGTPG